MLHPHEVSEWRFAAPAELDMFVIPGLARRIRACLAGVAVYLEEGEPPADG